MTGGPELLRALAMMSEPPSPEQRRAAELIGLPDPPSPEQHTLVFGLQLYPYASVYLGPEGMLGGDARDRIAGFWDAVGYEVPREPDHLASLLGLYAALLDAELKEADDARRVLRHEARLALLWEHLLPWLPMYLAKFRTLGPFFEAWSEILGAILSGQIEDVAGRPLPIHLSASQPVSRDDDVMAALLAPARTGMVITRSDLMKMGKELGLGVRIGERAFILRSLFSQAPEAVADRLAAEAERWQRHHLSMHGELGVIAGCQGERAEAVASLLLDGTATAEEVVASGSRS